MYEMEQNLRAERRTQNVLQDLRKHLRKAKQNKTKQANKQAFVLLLLGYKEYFSQEHETEKMSC